MAGPTASGYHPPSVFSTLTGVARSAIGVDRDDVRSNISRRPSTQADRSLGEIIFLRWKGVSRPAARYASASTERSGGLAPVSIRQRVGVEQIGYCSPILVQDVTPATTADNALGSHTGAHQREDRATTVATLHGGAAVQVLRVDHAINVESQSPSESDTSQLTL